MAKPVKVSLRIYKLFLSRLPSLSALMSVASQIIKVLKQDPVFAKVNAFMKKIRAIGSLLTPRR
jgi:hypothetical protein